METTYKLGSLFDGSGGFPLAGSLCGITPVWAAEIEPYPIAVTRSRFSYMKHLGDISKVNGAEVEPVDIITFGSPCQDLSVAGKRAGLKHTENGDEETTRSGLFMEAVRIIKEMREATNGAYPRFALWENVPGAFSSNKGEDFRIVLEELIKIVEPGAVMPAVPQKGWAYADSYCGDGWSLAYRVFDAQYWGVPQRRRRIYLVADFGGECAREVLFEREGLRGYFAESGTPWERIACDAERGVGADDCEGECVAYALDQQGGKGGANFAKEVMPTLCSDSHGTPHAVAYTMQDRAGKPGGGKGFLIQKDRATSLRTGNYQYVFQPTAYSFDPLGSNSMKSKNPHSGCRQVDVARTIDTTDPNPGKNQGGIAVVEAVGLDGYNSTDTGDKAATLGVNCGMSTGRNGVVECIVLDDQGGQQISVREDGKSPTLRAEMHGNVPCVMEAAGFCPEESAKTRGVGYAEEQSPTLRAGTVPAVVYDARGNGDGAKASTITGDHENRVTDYTSVVVQLASGKEVSGCLMASGYEKLGAQEMFSGDYTVIEKRPVCCIDDGKIGKAERAGDSVAFGWYPQMKAECVTFTEEKSCCLVNGTNPGFQNAICSVAFPQQAYDKFIEDGVGTTLKACGGSYGGGSETLVAETKGVRYIVRRLTPTECARLQGFADQWGDIEEKTEFSDEEYLFWLEVRNTHAAINSKAVKDYTKQQMLNWYNKLHTDSAEYKLWGNGIALPTALYCLQGIADALMEGCHEKQR